MIRTGKVLDSTTDYNKDGDTLVRLLTVELTDSDDIQTVEYYDDGGNDYLPPDGAEVVVIDVTPSHRVAIGVDDLINSTVSKGERLVYSVGTDGAERAATIYLKNDGDIEINGNTDTAVRFSELESAFNELKSDFNALVTAYNAHTHTIPPGTDAAGGTSGPTSSTGSSSAADISGAEIDEIKVP